MRKSLGLFYSGKVMRPKLNALLLLVCLLLVYGLLMMTSASVEIAKGQYGDAFYFFKRQGIFALVGLFVLFITLQIPTVLWKKYSWLLLLGSFLLLILVLVPGIGKIVNGSARWIDLGFFNLQPSELAKIFIVIYLASYLDENLKEVKQTWAGFMKPIFIIVAAAFLLQLEPDHGALVILMLTSFCMIFLAGAKIYRFLPMFVVCAGMITYLAMTKSYVIARFSSFLNPWAAENVFDSSYQLTQALIAFGRGEWFGVGLGNSIQKLYFLPEAHNDFVLAIIGEELGLIGVSVVLVLFCLLVFIAFSTGKVAEKNGSLFQAFLAYGIGLLFSGQALINIGVNLGLLPTKGLTLPFMSYGGASLIICCFMAALLIRIQYETQFPEGRAESGRG
tara:strand:- start:318 stop:1490 length:1173 start_codon:yes stop_codon:yes gene_type:complete